MFCKLKIIIYDWNDWFNVWEQKKRRLFDSSSKPGHTQSAPKNNSRVLVLDRKSPFIFFHPLPPRSPSQASSPFGLPTHVKRSRGFDGFGHDVYIMQLYAPTIKNTITKRFWFRRIPPPPPNDAYIHNVGDF